MDGRIDISWLSAPTGIETDNDFCGKASIMLSFLADPNVTINSCSFLSMELKYIHISIEFEPSFKMDVPCIQTIPNYHVQLNKLLFWIFFSNAKNIILMLSVLGKLVSYEYGHHLMLCHNIIMPPLFHIIICMFKSSFCCRICSLIWNLSTCYNMVIVLSYGC